MTVTDLKLAFATALLMALLTIIIGAVFGRRVAWAIGIVGAVSVILPLILIVVLGVAGILEAAPANAGQTSANTVGAIVDYLVSNLPGLIISSIAGALVGFLVTGIKRFTPKRVRRHVARKIRVRA